MALIGEIPRLPWNRDDPSGRGRSRLREGPLGQIHRTGRDLKGDDSADYFPKSPRTMQWWFITAGLPVPPLIHVLILPPTRHQITSSDQTLGVCDHLLERHAPALSERLFDRLAA